MKLNTHFYTWAWISTFIPHITEHVITYPCWDLSLTLLVKTTPEKQNFRSYDFHASQWASDTVLKNYSDHEYPDKRLYVIVEAYQIVILKYYKD